MLFGLLLPAALLSRCALGSPIARRQLRAVDQVYAGPSYNLTTTNGTCNGTDAYNFYTGDGNPTDGWPSMDQWASFEYLCTNIGATGPNNSPEETASVGNSIVAVAATTNVDPRFILPIMMQKSKGCVRVQTTYGSNANPGLMRSHTGPNSCAGTTPCPSYTITGMLSGGVGGTPSGDGLAAIMDQLSSGNATNQLSFGNDSSVTQMYYRAARMYNSGGIAATGDLGEGVTTHCYVSDVANRLTGWVLAESECTLDNAASVAYTTPISLPVGNSTTTTSGCILVQPGV